MVKRFARWILRNECTHNWVFFGHKDLKPGARAILWKCCNCTAEKQDEFAVKLTTW